MLYLVSIWLLPVLIAITFHEAAHAFVPAISATNGITAWTCQPKPVSAYRPTRHHPFAGTVASGTVAILVWIRQARAGQFSRSSQSAQRYGVGRCGRTRNEYWLGSCCCPELSSGQLFAGYYCSMGRPESQERSRHQCRSGDLQFVSITAARWRAYCGGFTSQCGRPAAR